MLLWFKTNAFIEYMNLFNLNRFIPRVEEYNEVHRNGYGDNFTDFLREYFYDKFLVRLVTCPLCLSFWLGTLSAVYMDAISGFLCAPLILFSYLVFNKML